MRAHRTMRTALFTVIVLITGVVSAALMSTTTQAAAAPADPGSYHALTAARILDTRNGTGAATAPVAPATTLTVTVLGHGGIPGSGVSAVVFNLTETNPTAYGFISAYPTGQPLPLASSLNFSAGETRAHLVVVAPGTAGQVGLYNGSAAPVDLVADVVGYYHAGAPVSAGEFAPVDPARILDTRTGNGAPAQPLNDINDTLGLQVSGRGGVPATGVTSVMINLTATRPSVYGYLAVTSPISDAGSSSVNFHGGQSVSNLIVAALSADGSIHLEDNQVNGHVDVVADVVGYFVGGAPMAAGRFGALVSHRLLDTRASKNPIPAQGSIDLPVAGHSRVPTGAGAAVLNVTVVGATTSGYLATYPTGTARPTSSTVNFDHNTVANLVIAQLGPDGKVRIFNGSSARIQVAVDVSGYFGAVPGPLTWSAATPKGSASATYLTSCGSPTFCTTFGGGDAYRYNGTTWSGPTNLPAASLGGLSCVASGFCVLAATNGVYTDSGGTWSLRTLSGSNVHGVSCTSANFCAALDTGPTATTAWMFNGSQWTNVATGLSRSSGASVSCVSASFCLATDTAGHATRYDGSRWTMVGQAGVTYVAAVSCATASFCTAVSDDRAVVFNGTSWGAPKTLDVQSGLTSVSCPAETFCAASTDVGYELFWNGTAWTTAVQVDPGGTDPYSQSCPTTRFCLLVGGASFLTGS